MKRSGTLLLLFLLGPLAARAGHLPGGNITYACQGGNVYTITLTLFRDCQGAPLVPQQLSCVSDCGTSFVLSALPPGTGTEVSQLCPADLPNSTCNGGTLPGIEVYQVETSIGLSTCDGWTISWSECCRSNALNVNGNPGMTIEARLNSATAPCNSSPVFTQDVIPYVCVNQPVTYNLGVTEPDGQSLVYTLIDARDENGVPVNYGGSYSGAEPFTGMAIDSLTGQITFTPTLLGNIVTVVRVDEYDQAGELAGSVMRDFLFVVLACPNTPPDPTSGEILNTTGDVVALDSMGLSVCPGATFCFDAAFTDPDAGQSVLLTSNVATVVPGAQLTTIGTNPSTATICVPAAPLTAGDYPFLISAVDDACPNTALTTYAYTLTVLSANDPACLSTGMDPIAGAGFGLFPSPANDRITVSLPEAQSAFLVITDAAGQMVLRTRATGTSTTLDVSHLAVGSYTLSTTLNGVREDRRFVVVR